MVHHMLPQHDILKLQLSLFDISFITCVMLR